MSLHPLRLLLQRRSKASGRAWGYLKVSGRRFCLFCVLFKAASFGRFVLLPSVCRYRFLACVHTGKRAASSGARRYSARWACNYHSGVKSGLIRGGKSRADQKDLGEDRTKNVKSCSLLKHRDVNLSESTLMFSEENLIKACVTKMVSEDDLTSVAFPPAVSRFTSPFFPFFKKKKNSLHLPAWVCRHCPVRRLLCLCCGLDRLNINEAVSPAYYKHKWTVIKDDISKPHSLPLFSALPFFFLSCRRLRLTW